jgi:hypothetical protein
MYDIQGFSSARIHAVVFWVMTPYQNTRCHYPEHNTKIYNGFQKYRLIDLTPLYHATGQCSAGFWIRFVDIWETDHPIARQHIRNPPKIPAIYPCPRSHSNPQPNYSSGINTVHISQHASTVVNDWPTAALTYQYTVIRLQRTGTRTFPRKIILKLPQILWRAKYDQLWTL